GLAIAMSDVDPLRAQPIEPRQLTAVALLLLYPLMVLADGQRALRRVQRLHERLKPAIEKVDELEIEITQATASFLISMIQPMHRNSEISVFGDGTDLITASVGICRFGTQQ